LQAVAAVPPPLRLPLRLPFGLPVRVALRPSMAVPSLRPLSTGTTKVEEQFDTYHEDGRPTGQRRTRSDVHRLGLWHRSVHIYLLNCNASEVLIQKRAAIKESFAGLYDVGVAGYVRSLYILLFLPPPVAAGSAARLISPPLSVVPRVVSCRHLAAGESSLEAAHKEFSEELGLDPAPFRFELLTTWRNTSIQQGGAYLNNELTDVYVIDRDSRVETATMKLQVSEVESVRYIGIDEYRRALRAKDPAFVPATNPPAMERIMQMLLDRCKTASRSAAAAKK
jgi:isopentenyldiphosphate isomerase